MIYNKNVLICRMVLSCRPKLDSILVMKKSQNYQRQKDCISSTKRVPILCVNFYNNISRYSIRTIDSRYWMHTMKMQCSRWRAPITRTQNLSKFRTVHAMILLVSFKHNLTTFSSRLVNYLPHSRNLMRVRDDKRMTLLKCGRLPVVSFLSELPKSEHDPQSFAIDLTLFTVSLLKQTQNTKQSAFYCTTLKNLQLNPLLVYPNQNKNKKMCSHRWLCSA